jgi:hypothetical protein
MKFRPERFGLSFRGEPEFVTDGCSGGMSRLWRAVIGNGPPWEDCCETHDLAYWSGGTRADRRVADRRLRTCVIIKGYPWHWWWGWIIWIGVRIGGGPWLPTTWRWGYRYDWPRGYER